MKSIIDRMAKAGVDKSLATEFCSACASVGPMLPTTLAVRHRGEPVSLSHREQLLKDIAGGEHIELEVDIVGFRQMKGRANRNFMRLLDKKKVLNAAAKSAKGMPFLADHNHSELSARLGTISDAAPVFADDGEVLFKQTLQVTTPDGVNGILRGTIDRFSVGWVATGSVDCSLCGTAVFTDCFHLPGQEVTAEGSKEAAVCEWVFASADLIEVSAVNVPAVLGTGIEEVRASMARNTIMPVRPAKENRMNHEQMCAMLGLPVTATEDEVKSKVAAMTADSARVSELETRSATLEANAALREEEQLRTNVEHKIAALKTEGKLAANSTKVEAALRKMAEADYGTFEAYCDQMPSIIPLGQQVVEDNAALASAGVAGNAALMAADASNNPFLAKTLASLGLTMENVAAHGPTRPMGESLLDRDNYTAGGNS